MNGQLTDVFVRTTWNSVYISVPSVRIKPPNTNRSVPSLHNYYW